MTFTLLNADAIEAMQAMGENSVDAIVTDPPYGLEFMGKEWDRLIEPTSSSSGGAPPLTHNAHNRGANGYAGARVRFGISAFAMQEWHHAWATEALRILKPGGHLLAFGGTRTYHRLACAIEDAGFEIRDCLAWMYGSGFPKSLDVSKAIDKAAGAEREVVGVGPHAARISKKERYQRDDEGGWESEGGTRNVWNDQNRAVVTAPATPDAQRWNGWGTALKPAFEPIVLARKPLSERNVAANVQRWGTGALNIDGCRIEGETPEFDRVGEDARGIYGAGLRSSERSGEVSTAGRWPANVTLGHSPDCEQTGETRKVKGSAQPRLRRRMTSKGIEGGGYGQGAAGPTEPQIEEWGAGYGDQDLPVWNCAPGCAVAMLDEQTGERNSTRTNNPNPPIHGGDYFGGGPRREAGIGLDYGDTGGASRFFYCPKADREERNRGLGHMVPKASAERHHYDNLSDPRMDHEQNRSTSANVHPTVKPVELMRWLCRMVTPKGGTVLDPFTGSGSTGVAAMREGFEFIGIEREAEYVEIARARIIGDAPLFNVEAVP